MHDTPKPRTGGLAILTAIIIGLFLFQQYLDNRILSILPYALLVISIAFMDDIVTVSPLIRFISQITVALLYTLNGLALDSLSLPGLEISIHPIIGIPLSVLFFVWIVNLYNFMDGMDGLSSGMAVIGFSTFALMAYTKGDLSFALINLVLVASALGFLVFNLPPSKIFLGDVGSSLFGVLLALFILWADSNEIFPAWLGVLVFLPFILDSTLTLGKRVFRGEKFWQPHCSHYYQRIVKMGFGHKKTLIFEYTWMIISSLVSIVLFQMENITMQVSLGVIFVTLSIVTLMYIDKIRPENINN